MLWVGLQCVIVVFYDHTYIFVRARIEYKQVSILFFLEDGTMLCLFQRCSNSLSPCKVLVVMTNNKEICLNFFFEN